MMIIGGRFVCRLGGGSFFLWFLVFECRCRCWCWKREENKINRTKGNNDAFIWVARGEKTRVVRKVFLFSNMCTSIRVYDVPNGSRCCCYCYCWLIGWLIGRRCVVGFQKLNYPIEVRVGVWAEDDVKGAWNFTRKSCKAFVCCIDHVMPW